jgi:hypothetical protein
MLSSLEDISAKTYYASQGALDNFLKSPELPGRFEMVHTIGEVFTFGTKVLSEYNKSLLGSLREMLSDTGTLILETPTIVVLPDGATHEAQASVQEILAYAGFGWPDYPDPLELHRPGWVGWAICHVNTVS